VAAGQWEGESRREGGGVGTATVGGRVGTATVGGRVAAGQWEGESRRDSGRESRGGTVGEGQRRRGSRDRDSGRGSRGGREGESGQGQWEGGSRREGESRREGGGVGTGTVGGRAAAGQWERDSGGGSREGVGCRVGGGVEREGGWVVFQKNVCLGSLLDPGGGGLPNPTESTMWGKGSSGARPPQNAWIPRNGAAARADRCPRVPTVSPAANASSIGLFWIRSESRRRASGRRDLLPSGESRKVLPRICVGC